MKFKAFHSLFFLFFSFFASHPPFHAIKTARLPDCQLIRKSERFHSEPAAQTQHQVQRAFLLDVVIRQRAPVFQLLPGKDQALLIRRDAFLVLDLLLHVLDSVAALNFKGDGLSRQSLDEDLHSSSKSEDQVESGLLLNIVICKGSSILKLLSSEDESLLVTWDSLLILDLGLHCFNGVSWLYFNSHGSAG